MDMVKKNRTLVFGAALLVGALLIIAGTLSVAAQANRNSAAGESPCSDKDGAAGNMMGGMMGMSGMMNGNGNGNGNSNGLGVGVGVGMGSTGMGNMMRDVDKHFIEQMIPHHQSAIAMADLALTKAQSPEIKALAADIKRTQTAEIEQMRAWYKAWYGVDVPTSSTNDSGGGKMGSGGMMGGAMNMNGNTQDLAAATDFDKAFIEQMIPHHQMAVMMAGMVLAGGEKAELHTLAQSISTSQSAEIEMMRAWYKSWYGTSAP